MHPSGRFMQILNGIVGVAAAASVVMGIAVTFIMKLSAGPRREPFWHAAAISAGIGATMTTVSFVLKDAANGSIWEIMAIGAVCGSVGPWVYALIVILGEKSSSPRRRMEKN